MAGPGPAPKNPAQRRNRRKETRLPVADPSPNAPPLPAAPNGQPWPDVVQDWYRVWAESPQSSRFLATDWQRLHMLAPQVLAYYSSFDRGVFVEIRLNESLLGATIVDRQRLRMDVGAAKPADPGTERDAAISDLSEYRESSTGHAS